MACGGGGDVCLVLAGGGGVRCGDGVVVADGCCIGAVCALNHLLPILLCIHAQSVPEHSMLSLISHHLWIGCPGCTCRHVSCCVCTNTSPAPPFLLFVGKNVFCVRVCVCFLCVSGVVCLLVPHTASDPHTISNVSRKHSHQGISGLWRHIPHPIDPHPILVPLKTSSSVSVFRVVVPPTLCDVSAQWAQTGLESA